MKILVTGASGFIASEVIKVLKNTFDIIALTRNKDKIDKSIDFIIGDITHKLPELPQVDVILHFAGLISSSTPEEYFRVNSYGTYNLLYHALKANIKNIVLASTMNVYGVNKLNINEEEILRPDNSYGESKVIAESICKYFANHLDFKAIVFRYSGVYGPARKNGLIYNLFNSFFKKKSVELQTNPENKWDPVYIKDVASVNIKAIDLIQKMKEHFNVFNIGYGRPIRVEELVNEIQKITKSKTEIKYLNRTPDMNFCMNIEKAKKVLSFKPADIEVSLRDYYQECFNSIKRGS